ncbi:Uma2 family endonuclease [Actinoplanes sp. NPDC048796]
MFAWFLTNGYGPDQVVTDCGIDVGGGRVPDLTVWAKDQPPRPARSSYAGIVGLLLAIEVVSRGSEVVDRVIKKIEYAKAGIPHYWIVERDGVTTVHRHRLDGGAGEYMLEPEGAQPMAWLLSTTPAI